MIRRSDEMVTEEREQMRDGNGTTVITHIFKGDELNGNSRLCAKMTLEPGCSVGLHQHGSEEEIYYIIKGQAKVTDGDMTTELTVGDAVLTRDGSSHSIENDGDEVLEFIAVINTY